ncbi:MAG: hypothetical protein IMY72_04135 [Bacteroidetes bacterium]|nr:hypothetical protein [Bacteroidota bacterium]
MKTEDIELDRLRIWDFYLTFPNEAKRISFPQELNKLKRIFKNKPNPYEDLIGSNRVFERMKSYQISALRCLASYGLIDRQLLTKNIIKRTDKAIPDNLLKQMNCQSTQKENIIKLVTSPFNDLPLYGEKGFKYRTKLIEFKYDPI